MVLLAVRLNLEYLCIYSSVLLLYKGFLLWHCLEILSSKLHLYSREGICQKIGIQRSRGTLAKDHSMNLDIEQDKVDGRSGGEDVSGYKSPLLLTQTPFLFILATKRTIRTGATLLSIRKDRQRLPSRISHLARHK